jgi:hypothetical protein
MDVLKNLKKSEQKQYILDKLDELDNEKTKFL